MSHTIRFKFDNKEAKLILGIINTLNSSPEQPQKVSLESFARMATIEMANRLYKLMTEGASDGQAQGEQQQRSADAEGSLPDSGLAQV